MNSLSAYYIVKVPALYFACILINYLALGCVFVVIPTCAAKIFGTKYGPLLYTIIVTGSAMGSILNIVFAKVLIPNLGM